MNEKPSKKDCSVSRGFCVEVAIFRLLINILRSSSLMEYDAGGPKTEADFTIPNAIFCFFSNSTNTGFDN